MASPFLERHFLLCPCLLILGAGKCGTSSLYHYLLGHPRVVPAYEKQIHYFVVSHEWLLEVAPFMSIALPILTLYLLSPQYHMDKPLEWYYSWFPTARSFLQHGALMTAEASPGYLPYPQVAHDAKEMLTGRPRLVTIGRNPLERMYSSYKYNSVTPTLAAYKNGRPGVPKRQNDTFYQEYLFY